MGGAPLDWAKEGSRFKVQGCGGGFAAFWLTVFPYRQPSPRWEGAPKGRIGHWRHEREREGASQIDDLRKHPSTANAVPLPQWGRQIGGGFAANIYGAMPEGLLIAGFPRIASLPLEGKVPRRGG